MIENVQAGQKVSASTLNAVIDTLNNPLQEPSNDLDFTNTKNGALLSQRKRFKTVSKEFGKMMNAKELTVLSGNGSYRSSDYPWFDEEQPTVKVWGLDFGAKLQSLQTAFGVGTDTAVYSVYLYYDHEFKELTTEFLSAYGEEECIPTGIPISQDGSTNGLYAYWLFEHKYEEEEHGKKNKQDDIVGLDVVISTVKLDIEPKDKAPGFDLRSTATGQINTWSSIVNDYADLVGADQGDIMCYAYAILGEVAYDANGVRRLVSSSMKPYSNGWHSTDGTIANKQEAFDKSLQDRLYVNNEVDSPSPEFTRYHQVYGFDEPKEHLEAYDPSSDDVLFLVRKGKWDVEENEETPPGEMKYVPLSLSALGIVSGDADVLSSQKSIETFVDEDLSVKYLQLYNFDTAYEPEEPTVNVVIEADEDEEGGSGSVQLSTYVGVKNEDGDLELQYVAPRVEINCDDLYGRVHRIAEDAATLSDEVKYIEEYVLVEAWRKGAGFAENFGSSIGNDAGEQAIQLNERALFGDWTVSASLLVRDNLIVDEDADIFGKLTVRQGLSCIGNGWFDSDLTVDSDLKVGSNLTVDSDLSVGGKFSAANLSCISLTADYLTNYQLSTEHILADDGAGYKTEFTPYGVYSSDDGENAAYFNIERASFEDGQHYAALKPYALELTNSENDCGFYANTDDQYVLLKGTDSEDQFCRTTIHPGSIKNENDDGNQYSLLDTKKLSLQSENTGIEIDAEQGTITIGSTSINEAQLRALLDLISNNNT